jgi:hypothetical protein
MRIVSDVVYFLPAPSMALPSAPVTTAGSERLTHGILSRITVTVSDGAAGIH